METGKADGFMENLQRAQAAASRSIREYIDAKEVTRYFLSFPEKFRAEWESFWLAGDGYAEGSGMTDEISDVASSETIRDVNMVIFLNFHL